MQVRESVLKGTVSGLWILWELAKVVVPAVMLISLLDKTGLLAHIGLWLGPVMGIFGLPGEAALILVTANFVSVYAGLATLAAMELAWKERSILVTMVMICHSAISETALVAKSGANATLVAATRVLAMFLVGILLNLFLP